MHTKTQTIHELLMALAKAGIVYTPPQDSDGDGGHFVFQAAYDAACAYSKPHPGHPVDVMRGMEFAPEIPGAVEGNSIEMWVIGGSFGVSDVFELYIEQVVDLVAGYIASNYWAQAATSQLRN